jgi:hypothetical protein
MKQSTKEEGGKNLLDKYIADVRIKVRRQNRISGLEIAVSTTALSLSSHVAHCEELQPQALSLKQCLCTQ